MSPQPEKLHPRGNADTCIRCKRKFGPGDRVIPVYIVEKPSANPLHKAQAGVFLTGEFEIQHALCEDPQLDGMIIVRS